MGLSKQIARVASVVVTLAFGASLAGCGSMIADLPVVGLPSDAPPRAKDSRAFLPVHDLPANRDAAAMSSAEQAKLQSELLDARARSAAAAAAK